MNSKEQAKRRAELIFQVQSGQKTATDAAKELGVSRKTYYEWENKALLSMMDALTNKPSGRPANIVDEEKEALKTETIELKKELLIAKQTVEVRDMLNLMKNPEPKLALKKNKRSKKKRRKK